MSIPKSRMEQFDDYWIIRGERYGNAMTLNTRWTDRFQNVVGKHRITDIRVCDRLGWSDSDLSFLKSIPNLRSVSVISDSVSDVSPAFQIKKLKALSLFCSKAKVAGNFTKFERLENVALSWRPIYRSVFDLETLTQLIIERYPDKDLTGWKRNDGLKELMLTSRRWESLLGIQQFPHIKQLTLFRCPKLRSLNPLAFSVSIQQLALDSCRGISDLSPVSKLSDLRELQIENCGEIVSLAPVARCKKLEFLQVAGDTTVLDGNFGVLMKLPKLKRVLLANRKHYSHTADELEKK